MFPYEVGFALGCIATLVATILLYIQVMPRKLDGTFTKPILQKLHDFFHFKKLYLEEVLKFFYALATIAVICVGAFMLLSYYESYHWGYYNSYSTKESLFVYGLLLIVVGPIVLRLTYEVSMMFILLVKNTIEINNKLSKPAQMPQVPVTPVAPVAPVAPVTPIAPPAPVNARPICPNCGSMQESNACFCTVCGQKL